MESDKYVEASYIDGWAAGRNWIISSVVLAVSLWVSAAYLGNQGSSGPLATLDMGVHQLGHAITATLGGVGAAFGGTLFQVGLPVALFFALQKDDRYFAAMIALIWVSINLFEVAAYIEDAVFMQLTFEGVGAHDAHDWHVILVELGLFERSGFLATSVRVVGFLIWFFAASRAAWLTYKMYISRNTGPGEISPYGTTPEATVRRTFTD